MIKKYLLLFLPSLLLFLPLNALAQKSKGLCFVTHFKSQVLKIHHPELRSQIAEDWLKKNLSACTSAQLQAIQSNSPLWLGTALTSEISSLIEVSVEASISGNQEMMGKLYGSLGKEGTSSTITYENPTARNPIVQAQIINGPISGSVSYKNINGDSIINKNTNINSNTSTNTNTNTNTNINENINLNGNGNRIASAKEALQKSS